MMIESAEAYRARAAVCASFLWDVASQCPAYGWAYSDMNPERVAAKRARELDFGTVVHLAMLEPGELDRRVTVVDADNWRTGQAQADRDLAYSQGRVPLLARDVDQVMRLRRAIMDSPAGLWFGEGRCEQSIAWEIEAEDGGKMPCKARVDCVSVIPGGPLVDLKTAATASPEAFQRACIRDGHHLRAAWYRDGWLAAEWERRPYVFVVVSKSEPHLVSCFALDERGEEWGRRLYRRGLAEIRQGLATGEWRGYGVGIETVSLPTHAEYKLAEAFAEEDAPC